MSRHAPCPYCEVEVDALAAIDAGECPECHTTRRALYALADGLVERQDIVEVGTGRDISPDVRRELELRRDGMDDPAEENQYLEEFGSDENAAEVEP